MQALAFLGRLHAHAIRTRSGIQGDRWSAEYHVHYDFCLENSYGTTGNERDARAAYLKTCTGH